MLTPAVVEQVKKGRWPTDTWKRPKTPFPDSSQREVWLAPRSNGAVTSHPLCRCHLATVAVTIVSETIVLDAGGWRAVKIGPTANLKALHGAVFKLTMFRMTIIIVLLLLLSLDHLKKSANDAMS